MHQVQPETNLGFQRADGKVRAARGKTSHENAGRRKPDPEEAFWSQILAATQALAKQPRPPSPPALWGLAGEIQRDAVPWAVSTLAICDSGCAGSSKRLQAVFEELFSRPRASRQMCVSGWPSPTLPKWTVTSKSWHRTRLSPQRPNTATLTRLA